jgi:hypothetical protein
MLLLLASAMLLAFASPAQAGRSLSTTCNYAETARALTAKYCTEATTYTFNCAGACSITNAYPLLRRLCTSLCSTAQAAQAKLNAAVNCGELAGYVAGILCPSFGK